MLEQGYYIFLLVVMILMMLMPNRESIHDIQQPALNRDQTRVYSPSKVSKRNSFLRQRSFQRPFYIIEVRLSLSTLRQVRAFVIKKEI